MDERCLQFSLWYNPSFTSLLQKVKDCNGSISQLSKIAPEIKYTGFVCGKCGKIYAVNADVMWIIASSPTKFLLEGEKVLCRLCCPKPTEMYRTYSCVSSFEPGQPIRKIAFSRLERQFIYNSLHDYYLELEEHQTSKDYDDNIFSIFMVAHRASHPFFNPYFQIDNTLFTILYDAFERENLEK